METWENTLQEEWEEWGAAENAWKFVASTNLLGGNFEKKKEEEQ